MGTISLHKPEGTIASAIHLPGSKSISNRVLMVKALSGLNFNIQNLSDSDDTTYLQQALQQIERTDSQIIDIGHAGTDMRFLTAYLASRKGSYELTGSERIQQRPIKELADVLKQLGAEISYKNQEGYPPLLITGNLLKGGKVSIKGTISSQFISALLLVAPYFEKGLELEILGEMVSKPYITMTMEIMKEFGAEVVWHQNTIVVSPILYQYSKEAYLVESDWSAASYFYSLMALSPMGARLSLHGLFQKSLQADAVCAMLYQQFGVETMLDHNVLVITKISEILPYEFNYNFEASPDIAQTLACTCAGLSVPFCFTGLQTLKVKETDRINALKNELYKFDLKLSVNDHSILSKKTAVDLSGKQVVISTYNDHRMAMSFAPMALIVKQMEIESPEVVCKSYPEFWNDLKKTGFVIKP